VPLHYDCNADVVLQEEAHKPNPAQAQHEWFLTSDEQGTFVKCDSGGGGGAVIIIIVIIILLYSTSSWQDSTRDLREENIYFLNKRHQQRRALLIHCWMNESIRLHAYNNWRIRYTSSCCFYFLRLELRTENVSEWVDFVKKLVPKIYIKRFTEATAPLSNLPFSFPVSRKIQGVKCFCVGLIIFYTYSCGLQLLFHDCRKRLV